MFALALQTLHLILKELCQQLPGTNHICLVVLSQLLAVNIHFPLSGELLVRLSPSPPSETVPVPGAISVLDLL